jgi:RimJ/RimL family protein N-acetyltransferase
MDPMLKTERLTLRPLRLEDSAAIQCLCGNWKVARMMAPVPHPYPDGLAAKWIGTQAEARAEGEAFHFGIERDAELIGIIGLERKEQGVYELGYWIGEPWWGAGIATEAAARAVAFAFAELEAAELSSGHFKDNPASGRVLEKCGFRYAGDMELWSEARGCKVASRRMLLRRGEVEPARP